MVLILNETRSITCKARQQNTPPHDCQHNNISPPGPPSTRRHRASFPPSLFEILSSLRLRSAQVALCPFCRAVRDELSTAICGYAIITDWTASAPISRHSGYRNHDQSRSLEMLITSLIAMDQVKEKKRL